MMMMMTSIRHRQSVGDCKAHIKVCNVDRGQYGSLEGLKRNAYLLYLNALEVSAGKWQLKYAARRFLVFPLRESTIRYLDFCRMMYMTMADY